MAREPFTRDQLAYIERESLRGLRVWNRALKHLDRIGASNHKFYGVIRAASDAEHALRVMALYERIEAEKRAKEKAVSRNAGEPFHPRESCP